MVKRWILILMAGSLVASCMKDDTTKKIAAEQRIIEDYLAGWKQQYGADNLKTITIPGIDEKVYLVDLTVGGKSDSSPKPGGYVIISYAEYELNGKLRQTNYTQLKDQWAEFLANKDLYDHYLFEPFKLPFGNSLVGFNMGVSSMFEGDSAMFLVPSRLAYMDLNFTTMVYHVKLHRVIPDIIAYNNKDNQDVFLSSNGMDSTNYIGIGGVFYKELVTGPTDSVSKLYANDSIVFSVKASFLQEGSLIPFDGTNENTPLVIQKSKILATQPKGFIPFTPGFAAAFDTLRAGTKATLLVPYQRAFGKDGYRHPEYRYIIIPEYTSLVYTVEVIGKR